MPSVLIWVNTTFQAKVYLDFVLKLQRISRIFLNFFNVRLWWYSNCLLHTWIFPVSWTFLFQPSEKSFEPIMFRKACSFHVSIFVSLGKYKFIIWTGSFTYVDCHLYAPFLAMQRMLRQRFSKTFLRIISSLVFSLYVLPVQVVWSYFGQHCRHPDRLCQVGTPTANLTSLWHVVTSQWHRCRCRQIFGDAKNFARIFPKYARENCKENDLQKEHCIS